MDRISRTERDIDRVELSARRLRVALPAVRIDDVLQRIASQRLFNQDYGQLATAELSIHRVLQGVVEDLVGRAGLAQGKAN
ncbi:hypothetical protein [Mycolicibacterium aubagnense]|uniref:Uncharacterized protein n=1 Tax=Mycolicibacterium aubagnense TaxID=319707 RepID=A0ABN5Z552_9MYCO|nr:hypothetical protein [Mycolicibacterium aubagnense]TLH62339.1 hypothetical protein C1S80_15135 [Mycolicibacterium aubagnense]BBX88184.1 hypothetical protein MAUB_63850 [Mycolicibacterium aubagnense]